MFGASVFTSLALVATGFAAWVLSQDARKNADGEVVVAAVHEESISMSEISFVKDTESQTEQDSKSFIFEPKANDTTGRVRYDSDAQDPPENLDVKIAWSIDNFEIVGEVFVEFKIPATVWQAVEDGYLAIDTQNANAQDFTGFEVVGDETVETVNYKVLRYTIQSGKEDAIKNTGSSDDGIVTYTVTKDGAGNVTKVDFKMNIAFTWGEKFGTVNPGEYYDTHEEGKLVEFQEMKDTLNTFKEVVHGIPAEKNYVGETEANQENLCGQYPIPSYLITVNAKVA